MKRIDTRKGSEVGVSKHHWTLVEKEIIAKAMHEARSKDELYRKIYHEPEGNIGVLRVKLMYSFFYFLIAKYTNYIMKRNGNRKSVLIGNSRLDSKQSRGGAVSRNAMARYPGVIVL